MGVVNIPASTVVPLVLESRTRDRVLQAIGEHGPVTATALAEELGLTVPAVRRHLENLDERFVALASRGRGRPARSFVLSDDGHQALESDYDHLATEALRFLASEAGPDAVRRFAESRVGLLEQRYAVELADAGTNPSARVEALVAALTRDGFAASARPMGAPGAGDGKAPAGLSGIQLCQGHCPVQHAAREFPQFCDAETDAFSRLLGVHVQRLATLAHGDHVCTTFVPAVTTASSKPQFSTGRSTR